MQLLWQLRLVQISHCKRRLLWLPQLLQLVIAISVWPYQLLIFTCLIMLVPLRLKSSEELDNSINKLDLETPQRSLLSLTWPIFIDLALNFATLIINTIMVGMVSVKAVAELTIGNQVFDLALIIFNFFNIGVCVVCAQALGANNKRLARRIIHIGLGVNLIVGTLVSLLIFLSAGLIVDVMRVPEEIAESSHNYLKILSLYFLPLSICLVSFCYLTCA